MEVHVAIALIHRDGLWFLQRRDPSGSVLPGLWEFPGGKIEAGESPEVALRRELAEEIDWSPRQMEPLSQLTHAFPERRVVLHPFRCEGGGHPATELGWGWFSPEEIRKLPIPDSNRPLLGDL